MKSPARKSRKLVRPARGQATASELQPKPRKDQQPASERPPDPLESRTAGRERGSGSGHSGGGEGLKCPRPARPQMGGTVRGRSAGGAVESHQPARAHRWASRRPSRRADRLAASPLASDRGRHGGEARIAPPGRGALSDPGRLSRLGRPEPVPRYQRAPRGEPAPADVSEPSLLAGRSPRHRHAEKPASTATRAASSRVWPSMMHSGQPGSEACPTSARRPPSPSRFK